MGIVEAGSLDLNTIHLRIGGIKTNNVVPFEKGNKFIIAEHFVDPDGNPVDDEQFDVSSMCYSLFSAPEDENDGLHAAVVGWHDIEGAFGRFVAGGLLKGKSESKIGTLDMSDYSNQFGVEPLVVRQRFAALLIPRAKEILKSKEIIASTAVNFSCLSLYWLRFRQVLDQLHQHCADTPDKVDQVLRQYREREESEFIDSFDYSRIA